MRRYMYAVTLQWYETQLSRSRRSPVGIEERQHLEAEDLAQREFPAGQEGSSEAMIDAQDVGGRRTDAKDHNRSGF